MVSHPDIQTAPTTTRPLVTRPAPHSDVDMRPASPRGGVFLPPPTSFGAQSHSQSPARGAMTLPPLSTISPLVHSGPAIRPQPYPSSSPRSSVPLANLIHPPPPPAVKMEEREREYKAESSTPRWYRLPERELSPRSRKRQSMEAPAPRYRFDTIDEHAVLQERPSSQPRHSMPASYGGHGQSSQSGQMPQTATSSSSSFPSAPIYHPPPPPNPGPSSGPWSSYPHPPSRRSSSMSTSDSGGAWFSIGDIPARNQQAWSPDQREAYHAGWTDALKAVENGQFGIGGHQYGRPSLLRNDIPQTQPMGMGYGQTPRPPPLRQSSSSDPGPPAFPLPYDPHPPTRSMSFGSTTTRPSPLYARHQHHSHPYANDPRRPSSSTTHPRHSFSSTSVSVSPISPGGGERGHKPRQPISCYPCRGRKLKCDGEKPCSQCLRRGGAEGCEYAHAVRRRGKGKKEKGSGEEGEDGESSGSRERDRDESESTGPGSVQVGEGREEQVGSRSEG